MPESSLIRSMSLLVGVAPKWGPSWCRTKDYGKFAKALGEARGLREQGYQLEEKKSLWK